ncbi:hypothetical protein AWM68_13535 [Fictibacillus phosphorivorans]|uniref:Uncharacterized protein n=1 Tax=Fictibacillus phosphorivorans TaxID=1221500 RepID=A0A163PTV3_9BACL|nr:hypothetical protein [Fictibacillus phosphorivorans]KZE64123.1 hypothetical protein AWM68_13535 [Fictibacillus phosphorivorans]
MEEAFGKRKIFATIMTSLTFSLVLIILSGLENSTETGIEYLLFPIMTSFIAAAIIVFFGLIASGIIEYFVCRLGVNYKMSVPVFVILHGVTGLFIGRFIFRIWGAFALMGGSLLFAIFDMWLLFRIKSGKGHAGETDRIYLFTIGAIAISIVCLYFIKVYFK